MEERKYEELLALEELINWSHTIDLNANDIFYHCSTFPITICKTDLKWILPICIKYDKSRECFNAIMSFIIKKLVIKQFQNDNYFTILKDLIMINPIVYSKEFNEIYNEI